jgi:RND family efflux transporter MFP subunit
MICLNSMSKSVIRWHLPVVQNDGGKLSMKRSFVLALRWYIFMLMVLTWPGDASAEPIELDGLIEPYLIVNVGSGVAGILESVDVERGDMVKKGRVLATMQSGAEKATMELARARANMEADIQAKRERLAYSRREQQRIQELYKKEALPFGKMDEVKTNRILAQLDLQDAVENKRLAALEFERSVENVKRMTIRSPIRGVVVERFLSPGEFIEDQSIVKLAQIDPLNVEVIAGVEFFGLIKKGMLAEVRPEEPVGGMYKAKVKIVDQVIDAASGTFGVRLELPNPKYRLPAGLKCKVTFLEE